MGGANTCQPVGVDAIGVDGRLHQVSAQRLKYAIGFNFVVFLSPYVLLTSQKHHTIHRQTKRGATIQGRRE